MARIINLESIQENTKKFYETCSDISVFQRELDQMLTAIEKNSLDFEKGKISKDLFKYNDDKMKKESAKIIKKINDLVGFGISLINKIDKEVEKQKTEEKGRIKKIREIKKRLKKRTEKKEKKKIKRKKRPKKKPKPAPTPTPTPAPAS